MNVSERENQYAELLKSKGIKFKRQVKIGSYTVDFLLPKKQIIEIDGRHHLFKKRIYADRKRDKYLRDLGYTITRIPAKTCLRNPNKRKKRVLRTL